MGSKKNKSKRKTMDSRTPTSGAYVPVFTALGLPFGSLCPAPFFWVVVLAHFLIQHMICVLSYSGV